jgi:hypothetical protein
VRQPQLAKEKEFSSQTYGQVVLGAWWQLNEPWERLQQLLEGAIAQQPRLSERLLTGPWRIVLWYHVGSLNAGTSATPSGGWESSSVSAPVSQEGAFAAPAVNTRNARAPAPTVCSHRSIS